MHKEHTCCMCRQTDNQVKELKTGTPAHPQCLDNAALGRLAKEIGWKDKK